MQMNGAGPLQSLRDCHADDEKNRNLVESWFVGRCSEQGGADRVWIETMAMITG